MYIISDFHILFLFSIFFLNQCNSSLSRHCAQHQPTSSVGSLLLAKNALHSTSIWWTCTYHKYSTYFFMWNHSTCKSKAGSIQLAHIAEVFPSFKLYVYLWVYLNTETLVCDQKITMTRGKPLVSPFLF